MESDIGKKGSPPSSSQAIVLSLEGGIIIVLSGSIMLCLFFSSNYLNSRMIERFGLGFMGGTEPFFLFFS